MKESPSARFEKAAYGVLTVTSWAAVMATSLALATFFVNVFTRDGISRVLKGEPLLLDKEAYRLRLADFLSDPKKGKPGDLEDCDLVCERSGESTSVRGTYSYVAGGKLFRLAVNLKTDLQVKNWPSSTLRGMESVVLMPGSNSYGVMREQVPVDGQMVDVLVSFLTRPEASSSRTFAVRDENAIRILFASTESLESESALSERIDRLVKGAALVPLRQEDSPIRGIESETIHTYFGRDNQGNYTATDTGQPHLHMRITRKLGGRVISREEILKSSTDQLFYTGEDTEDTTDAAR